MLNRNAKSRHPRFVFFIVGRENTLHFTIKNDINCRFFIGALYQIEVVLFPSYFAKDFKNK